MKGQSKKENESGGDKSQVDGKWRDWLGFSTMGLDFPSTAATL